MIVNNSTEDKFIQTYKNSIKPKYEASKQKFVLSIVFSALVFLVFLVTLFVVGVAVMILYYTGALTTLMNDLSIGKFVVIVGLVCLVVGTVMSYIGGKIPLRTVLNSIKAMDELSRGNYEVRIVPGKIIDRLPPLVRLADSFNNMAEQLEKTEVLRSDFINNFSHEFKTPIVSIAGFAKLLKKGNLSKHEQEEYLSIIEEESLRLSHMAMDVMYMTRLENQAILTGLKTYNLSEQIRNAFLLLENEWSTKNIDIDFGNDEYCIYADEEMLMHSWINLIDNAIKFTPEGGTISAQIEDTEDRISVVITNSGSTINQDEAEKIFMKFYQIDKSRNTKGNGIGLAVVKRVAELHGGSVSVSSKDNTTSFTVSLPK